MKNLIALLTAIAMVVSTPGISLAAFTSDGTQSFSASSGTISGTSGITVPFSASLKKLSDNTSDGSVTWTGITAGSTGWLKANQYISVKGFATYTDWGVQIYSDNMNGSASPKYTGTGNPAGLVRVDNTMYSLPMCWRTKVGYYDPVTGLPTKTGSASIIAHELEILDGISGTTAILYDAVTPHDLDPADPDNTTKIHAPGQATQYFPWFYLMDKNTDLDSATAGRQTFGDYYYDTTFIGSDGYHHAPGSIAAYPINYATPSNPNDTYYVYMGAKFTLAVPGKTYSTSKLIVEMYHL